MLNPGNHKKSRLQEKRAAADYSGTLSPGSGNMWFRKADVRSDRYLIECKTTTKASYTLKAETMGTVIKQAIVEDRIPLLEIEFSSNGLTCVIMDKNDFMEMKNTLEEYMNGP